MGRDTIKISPQNVTLAAIAKEANLSRSGVSRALHNHPAIPEATRRRVQAIASRLGFVSDARIARAYSLIRMTGSVSFRGTLGFLNAYPLPLRGSKSPSLYLTSLYKDAEERAEELGYRLDELSVSDSRLTSERIQSILEIRNIQGILVPPLPDNFQALPIPWDRFSCVAMTHSLREPVLHRVTPNQYQNMLIALRELQRRGYRRIGFMVWKDFSRRVNDSYHGAYFAFQNRTPEDCHIPILETKEAFDAKFDEWNDRFRPDAIIGIDPSIVEILDRRALLSGDSPLAFVSLGGAFDKPRHPLDHKVSFVCQNIKDVARCGIDLLVAQIDRRELGVPAVANFVQISGKWMEGETTPRRQAAQP